MGAGREHGHAPARHAGSNEALIHDQRIRLAIFAAEAVVAGEPGLVAGYTIDRTAAEKEASADGMGIVMGDHLAAGLCDVFESGFVRQHEHHAARQQNAALIRPAWMKI